MVQETYEFFVGPSAFNSISDIIICILHGHIVSEYKTKYTSQALTLGLVWTAMTLIFEFGFGRWRGNSWETLFEEYNILKGRLWVFVPIWISIAPYVFYRYYGRH